MKTTIFICILYTLSFQVFAMEDTSDKQQSIFDKKTTKAFSKSANTYTDKNAQISMDTSNSFQNVILSRVNKNGKIETYCTDNKNNAKKFLNGESLASIERGVLR